MRLRVVAALALAVAALAMAGCETTPVYEYEEVPEGGALPEPYYGTPGPPVYYGPPVVYYEYRYGPYWWYPYRVIPGPIIVNPPTSVTPPRRQTIPRGGGGTVIEPPPSSPPRRQTIPR